MMLTITGNLMVLHTGVPSVKRTRLGDRHDSLARTPQPDTTRATSAIERTRSPTLGGTTR
jgi:hypothetical protein